MSDQEIEAIAERVAERLLGRTKASLSPAEYASRFGIGLRTVYRAISQNRLPVERVGRRVLIPVNAKVGV